MILPKLYLPLDHDHSRISRITVYTALYSSDMIIADITYFFQPKGHSRTFFRKNVHEFLSAIISGQFHGDPENLTP